MATEFHPEVGGTGGVRKEMKDFLNSLTFQQISLDSTKFVNYTMRRRDGSLFSSGWVPSGNPWLTWSTEEATELQPRVNASTWMLATEEFKLTSEHPTICIILIRGEWQRAKNDVLDKLSTIENMGYFFYEYQVWSILIYPMFNSILQGQKME